MSRIKEYIKRGLVYVKSGVPNKIVKVNIAQINYGGILKDKKILITGGSRGLGFAIAEKCLKEQAKVCITGRSMDALNSAKEKLGNPQNLYLFEHDVRNFHTNDKLIHNARVAMGGIGSDAAIEAADVVIMNDSLTKLELAIKLAKKTMKICRQNVAIVIGLKVLVLLITILGFSNMWIAVFADVGVAMIAVINAIRIVKI